MIRVLRLMEYEFQSYEDAERHFSYTYIPANGSKPFSEAVRPMTIRSTILVTPFSVAGEFSQKSD